VFAFYPNKQITTGEGGMVVTDDGDLAAFCRSRANQGRDGMGAWLRHEHLGYNYRLDEMSAALGLSQMRRLEIILARRERVARWYGERIARLDGVRAPIVQPWATMSWFVYVVTLSERSRRDVVIERLARAGVPSRAYFEPVHLQPYVRELFGDLSGTLPRTEALALRTLALPFHGGLNEEQIDRVVDALARAISAR
jgi:perosamine synthetase